MTGDDFKTIHVVIEGRVQGVWFRGWTRQQALALGLGGWVANRRDGSVEAEFEGPAVAVDDMITQCRQGPPHASVISVESTDVPRRNFQSFEVRR